MMIRNRISVAACLSVFVAMQVLGAEPQTLTAGTAFSTGTWSPSAPTAGGAADAALVLSPASPWTVANDLGTDGWFTLNALTFATGGTLSGDGLAFTSGGTMTPTLVVQRPATNTAPIRLDADLTISGTNFTQRGAIGGTGNLIVDGENDKVYLEAPFTSTGSLHVNRGEVFVKDVTALGEGAVYVNTESPSGQFRRLILRAAGVEGGMTVANPFVLGKEDTAKWTDRLRIDGGTVSLIGAISVNNSKIAANNSARLTIRGGVTGNKLILVPDGSSQIVVAEKPLNLTGDFFTGSGGKVFLNVAGSSFARYTGFNSTTLVCGGAHYFPDGKNFASQKGNGSHARIDLNGSDQILGSFTGEGAATDPFTIQNTASTLATVTIRQGVDNDNVNLHFKGTLNVIKEGTARLTFGEGIAGNVTVREGTLYIGRDLAGELLARTVTVEGGTFDLGGQTVRCRRLVVKTGASVRNGSLVADETVLESGAVVTATIKGNLTKDDAGATLLLPGVSAGGLPRAYDYQMPSGTVLYFPFDGSLAEARCDVSGNNYELKTSSGTAVFSTDGRQDGCLYFDGKTVLNVDPFPAQVPTGSASYTVCAWVKAAETCANSGGWLGYGTNGARLRANNFRVGGSNFSMVYNYWWDCDVSGSFPENRSLKEGWRYVVSTYDNATKARKIYLDGVCVKTDTREAPNFGDASFILGKTLNDASFTGWLDDLLIANRAFSDAEIQTLYTNGGVSRTVAGEIPPAVVVSNGTLRCYASTSGAVVQYRFASVENLLADSTANGYTLQIGGGTGASFSTDSPFANGTSLQLDGSTYLTTPTFPAKLPSGGASRTLACFLKPVDGCGLEGAAINWGNAGTYKDYHNCNLALRNGNGTELALSFWGFDGHRVGITKANLFDHWNSFVAVWDGDAHTMTYYLNGVRSGETTTYNFTPATVATDFRIGAGYEGYGAKSFFKGNLAEIGVWDRPLAAEEVALYHQAGLGAVPATLPATSSLEVASGASFEGSEQTLARLTGAGNVTVGTLTVTDEVNATVAVTGNLTLGADVSVVANTTPVAVSGTLTLAAAEVQLPTALPTIPATFPLFTAETFVGEATLAHWTFTNVPQGLKATARVKGNALEVVIAPSGTLVIFR